jgi:hypothetical protein
MRKRAYISVAILWCAAFPASQAIIKLLVWSPEGTLGQVIAVFICTSVIGIAAVLLDPQR